MKYITVNTNTDTGAVTVVEVVEATIASGFLFAPRPDIQVGDVLTDYELMLVGLTPWDESLVPPTEEAEEATISES